jgi:hypothetical protein
MVRFATPTTPTETDKTLSAKPGAAQFTICDLGRKRRLPGFLGARVRFRHGPAPIVWVLATSRISWPKPTGINADLRAFSIADRRHDRQDPAANPLLSPEAGCVMVRLLPSVRSHGAASLETTG